MDDTLYVVTCCSRRGYYFELALHRKKAGQGWESENYLVTPFTAMYRLWVHKMTLDTVRNRLFLSYYSQGGGLFHLNLPKYEAYMNIWPDDEQEFLAYAGGPPTPTGGSISYLPIPREMTTIVSDDGGDTWRLAVTADFLTPIP